MNLRLLRCLTESQKETSQDISQQLVYFVYFSVPSLSGTNIIEWQNNRLEIFWIEAATSLYSLEATEKNHDKFSQGGVPAA